MRYWIILLVLAISACSQEAYEPKAEISIEPDKLTIGSGEISEEVTISVTKKDAQDVPVSFTIELVSPNAEMFLFLQNNKSIESIKTGTFNRRNDRLSYVFRVQAKKADGSRQTVWGGTLNLIYNNTIIDSEELRVTVR